VDNCSRFLQAAWLSCHLTDSETQSTEPTKKHHPLHLIHYRLSAASNADRLMTVAGAADNIDVAMLTSPSPGFLMQFVPCARRMMK